MAVQEEKFLIYGMTCAACQEHVRQAIASVGGVKSVEVNLLAGTARAVYEGDSCSEQIILAVKHVGYQAKLMPPHGDWSGEGRRLRSETFRQEQTKLFKRFLITLAFLGPLLICSSSVMFNWPISIDRLLLTPATFWFMILQCGLALAAILANISIFSSGLKNLLAKCPNMDTLVSLGTLASFVYSTCNLWTVKKTLIALESSGLADNSFLAATVKEHLSASYFDSCVFILLFVALGKYLEGRAKAKTSLVLEQLADFAPKTAFVRLSDGSEVERAVSELRVGDILIIRPGQVLPVDGSIVSGSGYLNEAALTGESLPVFKQVGQSVLSGSINCDGCFDFSASQVGSSTTLAQIIRLVDEASSSKAPSSRLVDKISAVFVPAVLAVAFIVGLLWYILPTLCHSTEVGSLKNVFKYGVSVLVVACPCALGLASPAAIMSGMGRAAQLGILIRNAQSLETLSKIKAVVLDKTGTLTEGRAVVSEVVSLLKEKYTSEDILRLAYSLEYNSCHPLAEAVKLKAQKLERCKVENFREIVGGGAEGRINSLVWKIGSRQLMEQTLASGGRRPIWPSADEYEKRGCSLIYLFNEQDGLAGVIALTDKLRNDSKAAVVAMQRLGLKVIVVTGDRRNCAENVAATLGVDILHAEVLPARKAEIVKQYKSEFGCLAVVGDGINDAPALKAADIGIAIGTGIDIAVEAADVVLMKDSLLDIVKAIELSKAVITNIRQNIFWAFAYNVLSIPIAAGLFSRFGLELTPSLSALAMSLSSVTVVSNALRLGHFQPKFKLDEAGTAGDGQTSTDIRIDQNGLSSKIVPCKELKVIKTISVEGMMCPKCEAHVTKALESLNGVQVLRIEDCKNVIVRMESEIEDTVLRQAVEEAGYTATEVISEDL
ncbi:MAG: heavy metal translocating P-type ATPase [Candidatus Bruticola sp.]